MAPRRLSRAAPFIASPAQTKAMLARIDANPEMRTALEDSLGVDLSTLTEAGKLIAINQYVQSGFSTSMVAQVMKAEADMVHAGNLALERRAQDRVAELEAETEVLRAQNQELNNYIVDLEGQLDLEHLNKPAGEPA